MERVQALFKDASKMPTGYFEAKPQRAVGFEEVRMVLLPDNAGNSVREALERENVPVTEYRAGDEADRLAKLNNLENVRFSLKKNMSEKDRAADCLLYTSRCV